jgi:hypothetical protein
MSEVDRDPPYYRRDLALVHHLGFRSHADACAPGIIALLEPIRERNGLVLELGCGSGLLTRHLLDTGHRVLCDLGWGDARRDAPNLGRVGDDWAIITQFSAPAADRFVRQMAVFVRNRDGSWRRDDERHDNVLVDVERVPPHLESHGVRSTIGSSFGPERLPVGLRAVIGYR